MGHSNTVSGRETPSRHMYSTMSTSWVAHNYEQNKKSWSKSRSNVINERCREGTKENRKVSWCSSKRNHRGNSQMRYTLTNDVTETSSSYLDTTPRASKSNKYSHRESSAYWASKYKTSKDKTREAWMWDKSWEIWTYSTLRKHKTSTTRDSKLCKTRKPSEELNSWIE